MCEDGLTPDGWVTVGCITCGKPTTVQKQFQNSARCNDCVLALSRKRFAENLPTSPITKAEESLFELAGKVETFKKLVKELGIGYDQLYSIKATLVVNCQPERELYKLGMRYEESRSIHDNMFIALDTMWKKIEELTKEVEDLRHDKQ